MGKWRPFSIDGYRLGQLNGQAVVTWREHGQRHRYRLGTCSSEVEARSRLTAWCAARSRLKIKAEPTVQALFEAYSKDRELDGKIVENFHYNWIALAPFFSSMRPDQIDADACRRYAETRIAAGRSVGSIWTELTRLRSAINWAHARRLIASKPYIWIPKKPEPKQRVLTPDEASALLDGCTMPHVRLFCLVALLTGQRTTAILELTWDRVDWTASEVDFKAPLNVSPLSKASRKGRARQPLTGALRAALADAKEAALTDHVIEWNGRPVSCIRVGFMAACRRAKLAGVSPHTLRHTFASWAETEGHSIEAIARLLAHKDPRTTRAIYAKPDPASMAPVATSVAGRLRRVK